MNVNHVAFGTVTVLGVATAGAAIMAATTAATVATVAYTVLAIALAGASIASITAWLDTKSTDVESYFTRMKEHAGVAIAALVQFTAQVLVMSLINGLGKGLGNAVSRKIGGPDQTIEIRST